MSSFEWHPSKIAHENIENVEWGEKNCQSTFSFPTISSTVKKIPIIDVLIGNLQLFSLSKSKVFSLGKKGWIFNTHYQLIWQIWKRKLLKTLFGKEKIWVTFIFSFSHNVFYLFHNIDCWVTIILWSADA